jgi:hypothetical protein
MMPPTKLPDGGDSSDHRWSATTRSSRPIASRRRLPGYLLDGLGRPSTQPQPYPGWTGRPLRPCQLAATNLSADLESP